jgi:hypothetical protein
MLNYEILIYWCNDDVAFVAEVPELPGCMAHGDSHETALANVKEANAAMDRLRKSGRRSYSRTEGPSFDLSVIRFVDIPHNRTSPVGPVRFVVLRCRDRNVGRAGQPGRTRGDDSGSCLVG